MTARSRFKARACGFTLIELMIVVAVVGILSMVAYPSYVEYVARGHRTQLKVQLQAAQQWMERRYSERYFYGEAAGATTVPTAFAGQSFATSPPMGEGRVVYNLGVQILGAGQGYRITAERAGSMETDRCGNPTVDNLGVKDVVAASLADGPYKGKAADAVAGCWR
jgi:type IV pilus assembly protein PilE